MDSGFDLQAYGRRLYECRDSGVLVPRAQLVIGDWSPQPNHCHANASVARDNDPNLEAVRGWVFFAFGYLLDLVRFTAHSVVRTRDGQLLYDITPNRASQQYPFIVAEESEEAFRQLVEDANVQHLDYDLATGRTTAQG
ncbi:MAG: hypothetical protein JWR07_3711 [Nevskia sp.]|nr:hypothetical protein [Nevskia sp.]